MFKIYKKIIKRNKFVLISNEKKYKNWEFQQTLNLQVPNKDNEA